MIDQIKYMEPKEVKALASEVAKYRDILINRPKLRGAELKKWFQFKDLCEQRPMVAVMALQNIMDAYMLNAPSKRYLFIPENKDAYGNLNKFAFAYTQNGSMKWKLTLKAIDTFDGTLMLVDDETEQKMYVPIAFISTKYIVDIITVLQRIEPDKIVTE